MVFSPKTGYQFDSISIGDTMADKDLVTKSSGTNTGKSLLVRMLDRLEWLGNKLPDPAVLFLVGMLIVWVLTGLLSGVTFSEIDPRSNQPIKLNNLMTLGSLATFLTSMVKDFVEFKPLGVVLVALLGVGVAEHSGFINACLKSMLNVTPKMLLTPMLILVAIVSHTAADAGYVLVIPIGGVMFYAAGRHPLAGIAAAFAGVSGGFSANFIPSGIDPLLAGLTESGVHILEPGMTVNPLCNWFFMSASCVLIVLVGWFLTDFVVEPRLKATAIDGDPDEMPKMEELSARDRKGMWAGLITIFICAALLVAWAIPADSALRAPRDPATPEVVGSLTATTAPLMQSIVPLIFLFFVFPGIIHGYVSGRFKNHRDVITGMSKAMGTMAYYLVLVFFAALFIAAFANSNLGVLFAVRGANFLKEMNAPVGVSICGIIVPTAMVNMLVGSASAKWAMLSPIFVPMMMLTGMSPELTQAAYRVGDSSTNIITPMMPYFPLVVVFCQRYVKQTGIGTVVAMMIPYSVTLLVLWSMFLLMYWGFGLPLGLDAPYTYPAN